jgi:hypothetical protein
MKSTATEESTMVRRKITGYVSEVDNMIKIFDEAHPKSESQLAEIKKYERIYQLRDQSTEKKTEDKIWEQF